MEPDAAATIADLLTRTNRRLRRQAGHELSSVGVTPSQARALRVLAGGPLRISDLARRLDVVPRSATSVVDDLETSGLAERRPDAADRRATLVAITAAGSEVLTAQRDRRRAGVAELLNRLSDADQAELIRLLTMLAEDSSAPHAGA